MNRNRLINNIPSTAASGSRLTASVVAAELSRFTPRDRQLLDLLHEHQTLTTEQIADVAFGAASRARNRLTLLYERDILDRFRHYQRPGSQSWRWTLGPVGAAILAAGRGEAMPRPSAVRDATARLAMMPSLRHLIATNEFFVALTAHARTHDGANLARWWNEKRCRDTTGALVRPDGHGVWSVNGRDVPFWVEVDLGTETLARVATKLAGYARLPAALGYPVLFWLTNPLRETNLHAHLSRVGVPDGLTVATAAADHATDSGGPAGTVWRVVGNQPSGRLRLSDLTPRAGARWHG